MKLGCVKSIPALIYVCLHMPHLVAVGAGHPPVLRHDLGMPAFAYNTRLKEVGDDITLAIHARHILALGSDSRLPNSVKGRLPEDTDVVLRADLVLSFAATVDRHPVSASCLLKSSCLQHVVSHLKSVYILFFAS